MNSLKTTVFLINSLLFLSITFSPKLFARDGAPDDDSDWSLVRAKGLLHNDWAHNRVDSPFDTTHVEFTGNNP